MTHSNNICNTIPIFEKKYHIIYNQPKKVVITERGENTLAFCEICMKNNNRVLIVKDGYVCKECIENIPKLICDNPLNITKQEIISVNHVIKKDIRGYKSTKSLGLLSFDDNMGMIRLKLDNEMFYISINDITFIEFAAINHKSLLWKYTCDVRLSMKIVGYNKAINLIIKRRVRCTKNPFTGKFNTPIEMADFRREVDDLRKKEVKILNNTGLLKNTEVTPQELDYIKACALFMITDESMLTRHNIDNVKTRLSRVFPESRDRELIQYYHSILQRQIDTIAAIDMATTDISAEDIY